MGHIPPRDTIYRTEEPIIRHFHFWARLHEWCVSGISNCINSKLHQLWYYGISFIFLSRWNFPNSKLDISVIETSTESRKLNSTMLIGVQEHFHWGADDIVPESWNIVRKLERSVWSAWIWGGPFSGISGLFSGICNRFLAFYLILWKVQQVLPEFPLTSCPNFVSRKNLGYSAPSPVSYIYDHATHRWALSISTLSGISEIDSMDGNSMSSSDPRARCHGKWDAPLSIEITSIRFDGAFVLSSKPGCTSVEQDRWNNYKITASCRISKSFQLDSMGLGASQHSILALHICWTIGVTMHRMVIT